jgi:hypothetical protein
LQSKDSFANRPSADGSNSERSHNFLSSLFLSVVVILGVGMTFAHAEVTAVTLQSPGLSQSGTTNLTSPIHVQATAEDLEAITGYVVYVDNQNVYRNFSTTTDAWITLPAGAHTLYVKAWDAQSSLSTATYQINITGFSAPTPPVNALRIFGIDNNQWTVDNNPGVGGRCNTGSLGSFRSASDPNTENASENGLHFVLNSECAYDDSLFYWKYNENPTQIGDQTNFLWDFWFYIPSKTQTNTVQAFEFDLFQAIPFSDGVREFMFGSQCNYPINQWDFWLPSKNYLTWVHSGIPCRFSTGKWHHATYFLQRVTSSGYQEIPETFGPTADKNTSLRFGTLTIDGQTTYLGGVSWSTITKPAWGTVLGLQHQLDSAVPGVILDEYSDRESLTSW